MTGQAAELRFEVTHYHTTLNWLTHGVECVAEVWYRTSPDEPRKSRWRTFSSIATNADLAEYWVQRQVAAWERDMKQKYEPSATVSP